MDNMDGFPKPSMTFLSLDDAHAEALAMSFGPAIQLCVVFWGPKEQAKEASSLAGHGK